MLLHALTHTCVAAVAAELVYRLYSRCSRRARARTDIDATRRPL